MATNNAFTIVMSGTSLVAGTAKTVIMLVASGTCPPVITEFGVGFGGVDATQAPVWVDLVSYDQATLGTSTVFTPLPVRPIGGNAATSRGFIVYTAEPTNLVVLKPYMCSPNGGQLIIQNPLGREQWAQVLVGTAGKGIGIRLTNPVGNSTVIMTKAWVELEE